MGQDDNNSEEFNSASARFELAKLWHERLRRTSWVHYLVSDKYKWLHSTLTIFNIVSAISVLFFANNSIFQYGISYFDQINKNTPNISWAYYLLALASLFTVLSSAVHYLMRYQERAEQHRQAGNEFAILKRSIEIELTSDEISREFILKTSQKYDDCAHRFPHVPRGFWEKCMKVIDAEEEMSVDSAPFFFEVNKHLNGGAKDNPG